MAVASTSVENLREHRRSGKLSGQMLAIYNACRPGLDYSRMELSNITGLRLSSVCGRVHELLEVGLLEEVGVRQCMLTGRRVSPVRMKL
jgi:hypothetical protein